MTVALDGVRYRYPAADSDALRDVTLAFGAGDVTLVTGRLGAGCSTLLLVAAGLAPHVTGGARSGSVTTLGADPASDEGRRQVAGRIGFLLPTPWTQLSGMSYTVREEVAFGPANLGWPRDRIGRAVSGAMALVGIEHLADRDPRTLSGGELQRVMLAGITAMDPEVLLLDEPTLELDPEGARMVYRLLPALAREKTVVLATTDVDRAVEVATRVVLLDRGSVTADGAPDDVLGTDRAVALGCSTTVAEIARVAGHAAPFPLTVRAAVRRFAR
jgi:energy-coupling factor transporter ATP-binding protein EcfA2